MQRPDRLYATASVASTGVLVGGVTVRAAHCEDTAIADTVTYLLPVVCVATVAVASIRRLFNQHEARRTKACSHDLAGQRMARELDWEERERELRRKEALLERRDYLTSIRVEGLASRLDDLMQQRAVERVEYETLHANYVEVTADFDALVKQVIREGANRFTTQANGTSSLGAPTAPGAQRPELAHQRSKPPTAIADYRTREHHESV